MPIFVNQQRVKTFNFPGGECQVQIAASEIGDKTEVIAGLNSSDDILSLLLSVDAVRRIRPHTQLTLTIPYFPYARQDRICNPGEALSLKVMADLINSLHCQQVIVVDPHSDVTPALLNHCQTITLAQLITGSLLASKIQQEQWALIAPDAGAEKKIRDVAKQLSTDSHAVEFHCARKVRNTVTGQIVSTEFHDNVQGKKLIIIDDICDGGQTFIELAKVLQSQGAEEIYLYVSHGIFSQGLSVLKPYFKSVYCYHTMLSPEQIEPEFLTVLGKSLELFTQWNQGG